MKNQCLTKKSWPLFVVTLLLSACAVKPPMQSEQTAGVSSSTAEPAQQAETPNANVEQSAGEPQLDAAIVNAVDPLAEHTIAPSLKNIYQGADALLQQQKWLEAEQILRASIAKQPASGLYYRLAFSLLKQKKYEAAAIAVNESIKLLPNNYYALNLAGVIAREQGDFKNAKDFYEKAIKVYPKFLSAHLNMAILADVYLRNYPLAEKHYKIAQALTPEEDKNIKLWLTDLKRRMASGG